MIRPGNTTPIVVAGAIAAQLVLAALGTGAAHAQDPAAAAAIEKIVVLNKKAMDDIDTADFEPAKKALLEAEKIAKRSGLDSHPVMARTYIHLGALYVLGYKDKQKAQSYFGKALDIQPDIRVDKNLNIAAVQDMFSAVQKQKGIDGSTTTPPPPPPPNGRKTRTPPPPPDDEPPPPPSRRTPAARPVKGGDAEPSDVPPPGSPPFYCPTPDSTPPLKKATLKCFAVPKLNVAKVVLYYKAGAMTDYESLPMTKSPKGWWVGKIPAKNVDGTSMQFYFEGMNEADKPVVAFGRAESPNIMLIEERGENKKREDCDETNPDENCDDNPFNKKSIYDPKRRLGVVDPSKIGVDPDYGNRRFWIGIGVGSGLAVAIAGEPESRVHNFDDQTADVEVNGPGWAGLGHLVPEIGFQFNTDWAVSIQGRHQYIPQTKKVSGYTASGAHAVLLRVLRYSKQRRFRFFFGPVGGGGEGVRFNIYTDTEQNPQLKDTVLIGNILVGGTFGLYYEISNRVSWVLETNAMVGLPKKGIDFDFNTGLQINFGDTSAAAAKAALEREEKEKQEKLEKEESDGGGGDEKPAKKKAAKSEDEDATPAPAAPAKADDEVPKN